MQVCDYSILSKNLCRNNNGDGMSCLYKLASNLQIFLLVHWSAVRYKVAMVCCSIVPVTPAQLLAQGVGGEETGMTVFGRGQLRLPPTTPPDQLPELLAAHAQ